MKLVVLLIALTTLTGSTQAEVEVGASMPFYINTDLASGEFGGYGFHVEAKKDDWFLAYDRLQNVSRAKNNRVEGQDFITLGKRKKFYRGAFLQGGLALNETSNVLGNAVSFHVGLGYEFDRYRITWSHWSNANTDHINHAFDALTLTYKLSE